jgi:hypothetical protein
MKSQHNGYEIAQEIIEMFTKNMPIGRMGKGTFKLSIKTLNSS